MRSPGQMMYSGLRKSELLKRFFSNASLYGLGTVITRAGGLLLLPLYWQKLSPADYGVIGLAQVLMVMLAPVLSVGLNDAMQRFYYEWPSENRPSYLGALWLTSCGLGLVICAFLDLVGSPLFAHVITQVPYDPLLRITLWSAFASNISLIPFTVLRVMENVRHFSIIAVVSFLFQAALSLHFLFVLEMGVLGYLMAILINATFWAVYAVFLMRKFVQWPFSLRPVMSSIRYALPLVPATVLEGAGSVLDRIVLDKFVPLAQIGLYNLGAQFGSALNVFNQIFKSAWVPFVFRTVAERDDGPEILGRFSIYYVFALCIPALAIALLAKEVILLIGDERYHAVYVLVPGFVLAYLIQGAGTAMGRGLDIAKRTEWAVVVPAVALVVSLAALYLLVPPLGVQGALAALLIATLARIGVQVFLAVHFYPRPLYLRSLLVIVLALIGAYGAGHAVHTGMLAADVGLKLFVIALAALVMFWFALDRRHGMKMLSELIRNRR